jgi:class 3 adenylate cyclase
MTTTDPRSAEAIDELLDRAWAAIDRGDVAAAERLAGDVLAVDASNAEAGELLAGGSVAGGQLRRLTLMFCDLVGSTALSARHGPERYRRIVGHYKQACRGIVEGTYDGHIAQVKGDGLLVLFGHPAAHEDDADRAVRAGLDVAAAVRELSAVAEHELGETLAARVAVHRGLVYLDTDEDEVYGLAPNLAARLQDLAPPGGLVISEEVLRLVGDRFATEAQEPQKVKGLDTPLASWRVIAARPSPGSVGSALVPGKDDAGPLVGRGAELDRLRTAWRARPASVVLQGEPGLGKTRLATTLANELADDGTRVLALAASARHRQAGFHPLRALLEAACLTGDPPARRATGPRQPGEAEAEAAKLDSLRAHLVGLGLDGQELVPLLAPVVGIGPQAGYEAPSADAARLSAAIAGALGRYLGAVLGDGPAALVVDDAHWLDGATADVVTDLVREQRDDLLVVVAGRPGPGLDRFTRSAVDVVDLTPLAPADGLALAEALDPDGVAAPRRDELVARSDGVPLFLEELIRAALDPDPDAAPADGPPSPDRDPSIPDALYEPLVARLHAIPGAAAVAGAAATIGPAIDPALLRGIAATVDVDEPRLDAGVEALLAGRVLERDPAGGLRFRHELLRAVAYELQPPSVRRALHGRIAEALGAGAAGGAASTDWLVLATHHEQADQHAAAVGCYERAAGEARQRGALAEARALLGRALDLMWAVPEGPGRDEREVQLRLQRGFLAVSAEGNASADAAADYERCLDLAAAGTSGPEMFRTLVPLWGYYTSRARLDRAYQVVDMGRAVLGGHLEWGRPVNVAARGMLDWFAGRFASAHELLESAAADLRARPDERLRGDWTLPNDPVAAVFTHLGLARFVRGDPAGARAAIAEAARLAAELPFPQGPFSAAYNLTYGSWVHLELDDDEAVDDAVVRLRAIADAHGWDQWTVAATTRRLELDARRAATGAPDRAEPTEPTEPTELAGLATAMAGTTMVWQAVDVRAFLTHLVTCHGAALAAAGDLDGARGRLDDALALAAETGMHVYDAETLRLRAHLTDDVERALVAAHELAVEQGAVAFGLRSARDLHRHHPTAATRERLAGAVGAFAPGAASPELDEARALLA